MRLNQASLLAVAVGLLSAATTAHASFDECVANLQKRAVEQGISEETAGQVLGQVEQVDRVLELDRKQPEFTASFHDYLGKRVTEKRVERGRELLEEHEALLRDITADTGVPGHYLMAFWGLETNFGTYTGNMSIPSSLTTLACDQRRSDYFTQELMDALRIVERGDVAPEEMQGSWAGAMGHMQFMPSVYLKHAVDADDSGHVDLWGSIPDALTSAGHFLEDMGWNRNERWGREVLLPEGFDYSRARGRGDERPLSEWREMGVRNAFGGELPAADMEASLLLPAGHEGPAFLVYENFRVIMGWNRSEFYALAVGHLADRIAGGGALQQPPPDHPALSRERIEALQSALNERGYDAGPTDGVLGSGTRGALRDFQDEAGLRADGFPDPESLERLGVTD